MRSIIPSWQNPLLLLAALVVFGPNPLVAQTGTTVQAGGQAFVNQGLVGVGRMPASLRDKFGETFGSFSAFNFQPGTWRRLQNGTYTGTLYAQPDRGYNVTATSNYVPRFNKISVTFTPAPAGSGTQNQVGLTLADTVQFTEANGTPLTSLDPTSSGTGTRTGFPALPQAFNGRLSLDPEGIVVNPDGSLWVSDEYGPSIFKFSADGKLTSVVRPPEAIIPKRNGADSFASNNPGVGQPAPSPADPTTGRQNNQGLEGLSLSPDGKTLFALLQSATRQDGGTGATGPRRHTRLLAYDVSNPATPILRAEYVVALPTYLLGSATRVPAQSEMVALNNFQFLVLARDSNGHGLASPTSLYRAVVLYDITGATNIAGTAYDTAATAIAPGGALANGIVAAFPTVLIDMNDATQLAKFGLNNGPTDDSNTLSEKWEALALVPTLDPGAPNDWFLFVGNDNDFITTNGFQDGTAYSGAVENDNMVLVYRLSIPSRLAVASSRAQTSSGSGAHIMGLAVSGAKPKALLIRALGPTLGNYGVTGTLPDPVLVVYNSAGQAILTNDNWHQAANAAEIRAATTGAGAPPLTEGSNDSVVLTTLDPGSYTIHVSASGSSSGISLIEVYEVP
jgi:hypothetical protein